MSKKRIKKVKEATKKYCIDFVKKYPNIALDIKEVRAIYQRLKKVI